MKESSTPFARTALYVVFGVLTVLLIWPFLAPLIMAAITASIFIRLRYSLPVRFQKYSNTYAVFGTMFTLLVIIAPLFAIFVLLGYEAFNFVEFLQGIVGNSGPDGLISALNTAEQYIREILQSTGVSFEIGSLKDSVIVMVQGAGTILYSNALGMLSNIASLALNIFFFLFMSFFLIRDGEVIIEEVKKLLPFDKEGTQALVDSVEHVGQTVILGSIASSIVLGVIMTGVFYAFGFGSPILWGMCIALLSLVPLIGTWLVYIPSIIFLAITGPWYLPVLFLVTIIFFENFLFYAVIRPKFLDAKTHLYPLAIFLAIVGGMTWFGPIGIVYGPLLMTITITLVRHALLINTEEPKVRAT